LAELPIESVMCRGGLRWCRVGQILDRASQRRAKTAAAVSWIGAGRPASSA